MVICEGSPTDAHITLNRLFCVAVPIMVARSHGSPLSWTIQEEEEEGWESQGEEIV